VVYQLHKLSALKVLELNKPGSYFDGGGLLLKISPTLTKSWVFRYSISGKERRQGLGPYPDTSLGEAREMAQECRKLKRQGIDPIARRNEILRGRKKEAENQITFKECATTYIDTHKAGWKNEKHIAQWRNTLKTYAYNIIGDLPVNEIDTQSIHQVLKPIWLEKTETATRVRQRIEKILDWAESLNYRKGKNPAKWQGHLEHSFPKPSKIRKVQHHPALPYKEMPDFWKWLSMKDSLSAKTLAFTILTAARNGESRQAFLKEIDFKNKCWNVPGERMKAGRDHRVPLSESTIEILRIVEPSKKTQYLFPGAKDGKNISETALRKLLKEYRAGLTVHGFRSTFRDWAAEVTDYPRELAEAALSHVVRDATEAAYQRGDMLEKRAVMMKAWSAYCESGIEENGARPK